jgi:hypothetical protein
LDGGKLPAKPSLPYTLLSIVKDLVCTDDSLLAGLRDLVDMILHDLTANQGGVG